MLFWWGGSQNVVRFVTVIRTCSIYSFLTDQLQVESKRVTLVIPTLNYNGE